MDFRFTPEDESFRREIRAFLKAEWPGGTGDAAVDSDEEFRTEREFEQKLGQRGWLTMAWPEEYGGMEATHTRQAIMKEECSYARAPIGGGPGGQATNLVGPAIIAYGTEDQKRRFLPPISAGEVYWCQGFSEPNAGSDLASLKTSARREGDYYVINGSKIWTSGAVYADYIHLLARTDPDAPKHKGISYFLIDMKSPGISYRPITEITGRSGFFETFFEDVQVPAENLLGEENRGWYVSTTALNAERSGIVRVGALQRWFDDLLAYLREIPSDMRSDNPETSRIRLAEHHIELEVARWIAYRVAWMQDNGLTPTHESSQSKAFATELGRRLSDTGVNILGLGGALEQFSHRAPIEGRFSFLYLLTVHWPISAGTNEIQRNVIAQRGLGLPR